MIKVILTGHGHFASGMRSSLELLNGPSLDVVDIDFKAGDSFEELGNSINKIVTDNIEDEWIILTDIPGGSPFKAAALAKINNPKIQVCSGCNLPLLMEIILSKDYAENIEILIDGAIENSKQSLTKLVL